jgi:Glu-tRNA(Gln) amidotransferase subunit E-like FAD-binding protein
MRKRGHRGTVRFQKQTKQMNTNQLVENMVDAIAEAVWQKLEARISEKTVSDAKLRETMSALLDSMNLEEHIDTDRIAENVKDQVNDEMDVDDMVSDSVSDWFRRADLTDYIDASEVAKELDLAELVREEVRKLNFTVKVD